MAAFEGWLVLLILVVNVVGELQRKRTLAASRGFLAAARLSCLFVNIVLLLLSLLSLFALVSYSVGHIASSAIQPQVWSKTQCHCQWQATPCRARY